MQNREESLSLAPLYRIEVLAGSGAYAMSIQVDESL
jgi:hypothetical protein